MPTSIESVWRISNDSMTHPPGFFPHLVETYLCEDTKQFQLLKL